MAKLACLFSFLILCGLSRFNPNPDLGGASMRLALAVVFATALVAVVRNELKEFVG